MLNFALSSVIFTKVNYKTPERSSQITVIQQGDILMISRTFLNKYKMIVVINKSGRYIDLFHLRFRKRIVLRVRSCSLQTVRGVLVSYLIPVLSLKGVV